MTHAAYVVSGYLLVGGVLAAYAWRVVRRGRQLAGRVAADQRPWEARS